MSGSEVVLSCCWLHCNDVASSRYEAATVRVASECIVNNPAVRRGKLRCKEIRREAAAKLKSGIGPRHVLSLKNSGNVPRQKFAILQYPALCCGRVKSLTRKIASHR